MSGYNPYIMPPLSYNEPMIVSVSVYMLALEEIDMRKQTFKARKYIKIEWFDQQLTWVPDDYVDTTKMYIPIKQIWTPDVYVINSFGLDIGLEDVLANVHNNGYVYVYAFNFQNLFCYINIYDYPFDYQDCAFNFGT